MARQSLLAVSIIWPLGARESRRRGTGNRAEGSLACGATVPTERPALRIVSEELIQVRPSTTSRSRQLNLRICRPPHRLMNLLDWVIEICLGQPFRACRLRDAYSNCRRHHAQLIYEGSSDAPTVVASDSAATASAAAASIRSLTRLARATVTPSPRPGKISALLACATWSDPGRSLGRTGCQPPPGRVLSPVNQIAG